MKEGDILTEDFIKKLPEEEQEICNALNRRTEFKVLRITYGMTLEEYQKEQEKKAESQENDGGEDENNEEGNKSDSEDLLNKMFGF